MSADAARCPHCGASQSSAPKLTPRAPPREPIAAPPKPVLKDVSSDEARAILAVGAMREQRDDDEPEPNVLAWMFLPHPRSRGGAWFMEVVLTILALPAMIGGSVYAFFATRFSRQVRRAGGANAGRLLSMMGVLALASFTYSSETSTLVTWCIVPGLAVVAREIIRVTRTRGPDPLS